MLTRTLAQVADLTGGRLAGGADPQATVTADPVTDSRAAGPGTLFVAVRGEHADGHDFAAAAVAAGAVAVLADHDLDVPCVVVDDTVPALGRLARGVLADAADLVVVAVTGSSGKTSTKDLLGAVLADQGPVVVPEGSFNNELGVPLTALRVDAGTRRLVVEMGARGAGHVAHLCDLTAPRVGVVLNVGTAHLGEFGDQDAVARAKGELVAALPAAADGGVAVLNADDARVAAMGARTTARVITFGTGAVGDVRATDVDVDTTGRARFTLRSALPEAPGEAPVRLRLVGEHHVANALAAAAAALALGSTVTDVAAALVGADRVSRWRMEVTDRPDGVTVVNDAYNANPDSTRAALRALVAMARPSTEHPDGRRTWAVLGEMLELGPTTVDEHDAVGRLAVRLNVSRLVAVGPGARPVHTGAYQEGSWGDESVWVPDADAALTLLADELAPGDIVLVKSSHGIGLRHLGDALAGLRQDPR